MFQNRRGVRSKFGIYDHVFRDLVDRARELHCKLLPEVVETGDFSLWRSPRRGAVLETTNQDVAEKIIELINRWRKKEAAGMVQANVGQKHLKRNILRHFFIGHKLGLFHLSGA